EASLIDVTVHPQSIIHSMATFVDGSTIAPASPPSMKLPISMALDWPHRVPAAQPALDFSEAFQWQFEPAGDAFSAADLAAEVAGKGAMPAVYNAVNDEAAAAFLAGRIMFLHIVECIPEVLDSAASFADVPLSVDDVL